jgi:signal transduction histidine kinase
LASNSIYELIEDGNNNFWVSGPNGISVINRHELQSIGERPGARVPVTLYGISEGLETIQMCGGEKPAGILTREGEVWFPSSKGPVRVPVAQPQLSGSPPVVIDQVMVDGLQIAAGNVVSLNPATAKLELHYGVVLLRSQERMRFRYMLEPFDKDWSIASADRVAYYTNLPPGKYRFRVAAYEMNNPGQVAESSIAIEQQPHFYRTGWFVGLCLLILVSLIWSGYRYRLGQVHARFQAVLKERNRLAREMHDTLIQGCVSVSALLEAHSSLGDSEAEAQRDLLECARTQMRTTVDEARQAVFDLRLAPESLTNIGPLLDKMTERISHEFGVPVECRIAGRPFHFEQSTVHELLMVIREAIYNAVRHAEPTRVKVAIDFADDHCTVSVRDNGNGFDPTSAFARSDGHYGLIGIKERVDRLGGELNVKSGAGAGTELLIEIPRKPIGALDQEQTMKL